MASAFCATVYIIWNMLVRCGCRMCCREWRTVLNVLQEVEDWSDDEKRNLVDQLQIASLCSDDSCDDENCMFVSNRFLIICVILLLHHVHKKSCP